MNKENGIVTCPIEFMGRLQRNSENPLGNPQIIPNVSYGSVPINPYTGLPVNPEIADKRSIDTMMKMEELKLKAYLEMEKQKWEYHYKKDLEKLKTENRLRIEEKQVENSMRRIEGMQARTKERENASYAIFKDSEGRLRLETKYPTRKSDYSEPVINSTDIHAYRICDMEMQKMVLFIVEADNLSEKIVLRREDVNMRVFERCLSKHGLAVTTSRERRRLVLELLLSFLLDEATVVEMPETVGWCKTNTGWIFTESEAGTIEGVVGRYGIK